MKVEDPKTEEFIKEHSSDSTVLRRNQEKEGMGNGKKI